MTRFVPLYAALLLSVPAAAQNQVQSSGSQTADEPTPGVIDSQTAPEDYDVARKKVVECEGEKFVFSWGAGARPTKVTLCSKQGATPDEVIRMLDDAATKLEQAEGIAEDRRVAIVQQIRAKISELQGATAAAAAPPAEPTSAVAQLPTPASRPAVPPAVAPATSNIAAVATTPVFATKPRLSFECYTPGDFGTGGPCATLGRDTRLTVKAGEVLAGATALRFVRNGQSRAELEIAQMRKGQSVRLTLPRAVCTGVVKAETEIHIVRGGRVVDSIGPYLLRC
ncbi:MAG: hypothetical protein ACR2JJ_07390 [Sphingomicrobium sp.]